MRGTTSCLPDKLKRGGIPPEAIGRHRLPCSRRHLETYNALTVEICETRGGVAELKRPRVTLSHGPATTTVLPGEASGANSCLAVQLNERQTDDVLYIYIFLPMLCFPQKHINLCSSKTLSHMRSIVEQLFDRGLFGAHCPPTMCGSLPRLCLYLVRISLLIKIQMFGR